MGFRVEFSGFFEFLNTGRMIVCLLAKRRDGKVGTFAGLFYTICPNNGFRFPIPFRCAYRSTLPAKNLPAKTAMMPPPDGRERLSAVKTVFHRRVTHPVVLFCFSVSFVLRILGRRSGICGNGPNHFWYFLLGVSLSDIGWRRRKNAAKKIFHPATSRRRTLAMILNLWVQPENLVKLGQVCHLHSK